MSKKGFTEYYDSQFRHIDEYKKMPQMMPWVGKYYRKSRIKIAFIGESHYLPENSEKQKTSKLWYTLSKRDLTPDEFDYTNTRAVLTDHYYKNKIWREPIRVMKANLKNCKIKSANIFEYFIFYNFFLRPAETTGGSILVSKTDIEVANRVFKRNMEILNPSIVIFESMKAWNHFSYNNILGIDFEFIPHPNSHWWNTKANKYAYQREAKLTGAEKLSRIVKDKIVSNI